MPITDSLTSLFGAEANPAIAPARIRELLRTAWQGDMCEEALRAICWRVLLGQLSSSDKSKWPEELRKAIGAYQELKKRVMPSIDKVKADPLSALSSGDAMSDEWTSFYKNMELTNFIKGDLDRLYLNGMEDSFFQTKPRRDMLLAILFIWSTEHSKVSYRQGMHEILGSILYVVECEKTAWDEIQVMSASTSPMSSSASKQWQSLGACFADPLAVEAFTYSLFERVMMELEPLYDPLPVASIENQPFIVQFCTKIQEHYLHILDPALCKHLEECYIQSQLYGLRWSRLMLGREFPITHNFMYRLWDFMFASCYDVEFNSPDDLLVDEDHPPNVYSVLASVRASGHRKAANVGKRGKEEKVNYVCTPMIGALGDFMLAMLIQVRKDLMEGDQSIVMGLLMHYPEQSTVIPILECADMIRRGVMVRSITHEGAVLNYDSSTMSPPPTATSSAGGQSKRSNRRGSGMEDNSDPIPSIFHDAGKKMTEKLSNFTQAVGSGINGFVQTLGPLLDAAFDDEDDRSASTSKGGGRDQNAEDLDPLTGTALTVSNTRVISSKSASPVPVSPSTPSVSTPTTAATGASVGTSGASSMATTSHRIGGPKDKSGAPLSSDPLSSLLDSSSSSATTPSSQAKHKSSLFAPNQWFQTSSSKNKSAPTARRGHGGVDLHVINSGAGEESFTNPVPRRKAGLIAQNNTVGDRLTDLAEYLQQFSSGVDDDEDGCQVVAKRLRALAEVLSGEYSVIDYDIKYANQSLPTVLSHKLAISAAQASQHSMQPLQDALSRDISLEEGHFVSPSDKESS